MLIIYLIHCVFVYGAQHGVCLLPVAQQLQSVSGVTHLIVTVLEQHKRGKIHGIELENLTNPHCKSSTFLMLTAIKVLLDR